MGAQGGRPGEGRIIVTPAQLTLGIKLRDDARFGNFHGARNADAAARLAAALQSDQALPVVLCGEQDTGKSHLLQAVCHDAEARNETAACISMEELQPSGPGALSALEQFSIVALDDLDRVAGDPQWEEALFHLYNRLSDNQHRLLVSMREPPATASFELPDLQSRLRHGLLIQLGVYRDDDRLTILTARAEQRGLDLSDEVSGFIMRRAPRRLGDLLSILDRLDDNSLQAQRRLTIPFVKSVMGW